ncbi:hypothetical protein [Brevibacterium renqingii]|uniref:hypothetical protein n=1 Tax=Brevibacterium renqingii TaxID=2776916 RepID=UPI0031B5810E
MKRFFAGLRRKAGRARDRGGDAAGNDDQRFGTGLWRHNRDRFLRAVDRYYTTAVVLHESRAAGVATAGDGPGSTPDGGPGPASANEGAAQDPIDIIVDGTHRLNSLATVVDDITAQLHRRHPVTGQIVPGSTRRAVGDAPELLTKASSKVAEAVLAASMARAEAPAGRPIGSSARATERFITDAEELLERAQENLARLEQP